MNAQDDVERSRILPSKNMFLTVHTRVCGPKGSILPVQGRRARSKRQRAWAKNFPAPEGPGGSFRYHTLWPGLPLNAPEH